jgi:alcohol dehydrogenase class IV
MGMRFEFATATRILFGAGLLREIGPLAKEFGGRALLVTGRDSQRIKPLESLLRASGIHTLTFSVPSEPEVKLVEGAVVLAKREGCDFVVSFGGGSAIDAGKAIAAMLTNAGEPLDYLEVIGRGKALARPSAPFIAVPTTAGTGSEVTRNAVLASPEHRVKVSLRSPFMLPRVAIVDPELTYDLPAVITASTGLDALTQLIEPYVSLRANPMTDGLCRDGIHRVARSLRTAYREGSNACAREDMALASLFGGLALANSGLGAVHGFAGPIGGMFPAPHGAICAALLSQVMDMNLRALGERQAESEARHRYGEVARWLIGEGGATAADGVKWVRELVSDLKIPGLASYGITNEHFPELAQKAVQASSMKANPIVLTDAELTQILERAL